ncbi:MAG: hypothetical protein GY913_27255 [Proteobacteria bacterium]|nr:hypothetical protein [Pseudomonadota bacterium]MCP4920613.1 hypothetical protein [Pseudomonadota bacterium]
MRRGLSLGLLALGCVASIATSKDPGFDTAVIGVSDSGMEVRSEPVSLEELELEDRVIVTTNRDDQERGELVVEISGIVDRPPGEQTELVAFLVDGDGNDVAEGSVAAEDSAELDFYETPCAFEDGADACTVELGLELRELDGSEPETAYALWDITAWGSEPGMVTTIDLID